MKNHANLPNFTENQTFHSIGDLKILYAKNKFRKNRLKNFLLKKLHKINKHPVPNEDVLGGKSSENNKNVLDYY